MHKLWRWVLSFTPWRRPKPTPAQIRMAEITREALSILEKELTFSDAVNTEYRTTCVNGQTINIKRPQRYV